MRYYFVFIFASMFVLFFSGCAKDEKSTQELILIGPGFLDMPIIEGSSIPDDCMYESIGDISEFPHLACIIYSFESEGVDGKDWDSEYVASLAKIGWKFAGGEANVYFLEKPIANTECSESLAMIGWYHGTKAEVSSVMEFGNNGEIKNGMFIFAKVADPICGDERRIK